MDYFKAPLVAHDPALLKHPGDLKFAQFAHLNMIVDELNKLAPTLHALVATTANITLFGTQTIDGVAVVAGDTVLVKNQSTASQNGLYIVKAGAWVRDEDLNEASEFVEGRQFTVADGTVNGNSTFTLDFTAPFVVGTTTATFVAVSGPASFAKEYVLLAGTNTYTGTIANFPGAWASGQRIVFRVANTNSVTNPTININGIGAKTLKLDLTTVIPVSGLIVGRNYTAIYDGTNLQMDSYTNFLAAKTFLPLMEASAQMTAGTVAGTYALGYGAQAVVSGTGVATPIALTYIDPASFASITGVARTMRLTSVLSANDVAPTGNLTLGLYPVTRPGTSGGAGVNIYTLGTVVTGSTTLFTTPAADSMATLSSTAFAIPTAGFYAIGVVSTATIAANSHVHLNAKVEVQSV